MGRLSLSEVHYVWWVIKPIKVGPQRDYREPHTRSLPSDLDLQRLLAGFAQH
jgi:hypothetical protein